MDGGVPLSVDEVKGRNTWVVWTAGNDRFWDIVMVRSAGALDLLKVLSSNPKLNYSRDNRWEYFGLVNEPLLPESHRSRPPSITGFGSTPATRTVPPNPSRTRRSIPASRSAHAVRTTRSVLTMGTKPALSACASFPIRTSTRRPPRTGMRIATTPDPTYYNSKDLIRPYRVGQCPAASATSAPIP